MDYIEVAEQEAKYQELSALGVKLNMAVPEVLFELKLTKDEGRGEVYRHWKRRSHSWTRNAYNHIYTDLGVKNPFTVTTSDYVDGSTYVKHTGGSLRTDYWSICMTGGGYGSGSVHPTRTLEGTAGYCGSVGDDVQGILFGINGTHEHIDDYIVKSKCVQGTGTNQLCYQDQPDPVLTWVAATRTMEVVHSRKANNDSGASIMLAEIGLYMMMNYTNYFCCMIRDVIDPTEEIYDKSQISVSYTFKLVYPLARQAKTSTAKASIAS
ncbi:MAG: hypothetical protein ACWGQW_00365 [bacterium]